jgi:hypothetical protein
LAFLVVWLLSTSGLRRSARSIVLMERVFGIDNSTSSLVMAVATSVSVAAYAPAASLVRHVGGRRVFQAALVRAVALVALVALAASTIEGRGWLAAAFAAAVLAGPRCSW